MSHPSATSPRQLDRRQPEGIGLATVPIGVNRIESVNVYIIEDGDIIEIRFNI